MASSGSSYSCSCSSSSSSSEFSLEPDEGGLVVLLEAEPGPAMDATVWSMLPNQLIERLLPLVPLPDLFTWRCVSKHWQALLTEERLRSIAGYKEVNGLLVFGARSTCPHQSIPQSLRVATLPVRPPVSLELLEPCAAAGGLICFGCKRSPYRLFMCNPLLGAWKELAQLNQQETGLLNSNAFRKEVHLIIEPEWTSYKVFLSVLVKYPGYVSYVVVVYMLYDSVDGRWTYLETVTWTDPPSPWIEDLCFLYDGLMMHANDAGKHVALDLDNCALLDYVEVEAVPSRPSAAVVNVSSDGTPYYVGMNPQRMELDVFRLDWDTERWMEVNKATLDWMPPPSDRNRVWVESPHTITLAAVSRYICLNLSQSWWRTWDPCSKILAFDLSTNSWERWHGFTGLVLSMQLCLARTP